VNFRRNFKCRERQRAALIASYLTKYITKDFDKGEMNKKRYELSRQHPMPESIVFYMPVSDFPEYMLSRLIKHVSGRLPVTSFYPPGLIHLRSF